MAIPDSVTTWLRDNAVPFETCEQGSGWSDLEPLRAIVGDARVVGLGEATHGTHEFFTMKHRILEFLVEEMGFTTFAIEANWPECELVNQYVQTGEGDARALLAGLYFWTWNTEEVLALINWMRQYNLRPSTSRKLTFRGVDAQYGFVARANVLGYLARVDPDARNIAAKRYELFGQFDPDFRQFGGDRTASAKGIDEMLTGLRALGSRQRKNMVADIELVADDLIANKNAYVQRSTADEFADALQSAVVVQRTERGRRHVMLPPQGPIGLVRAIARAAWITRMGRRDPIGRDGGMAATLAWLMEREGPASKVVLWAHNGHVGAFGHTMGRHLREHPGTGYRVFGFTFNSGAFVTRLGGKGLKDIGEPQVVEAPPPSRICIEPELNQLGLTRAIINFGSLEGEAERWFAKPRAIRSFGAAFNPKGHPNFSMLRVELARAFDALIYIDHTTPAKSLD